MSISESLGLGEKINSGSAKLFCFFTTLKKSQIVNYLRPFFKAVKGQKNDVELGVIFSQALNIR